MVSDDGSCSDDNGSGDEKRPKHDGRNSSEIPGQLASFVYHLIDAPGIAADREDDLNDRAYVNSLKRKLKKKSRSHSVNSKETVVTINRSVLPPSPGSSAMVATNTTAVIEDTGTQAQYDNIKDTGPQAQYENVPEGPSAMTAATITTANIADTAPQMQYENVPEGPSAMTAATITTTNIADTANQGHDENVPTNANALPVESPLRASKRKDSVEASQVMHPIIN